VKAIYLIKNGRSQSAFEMREVSIPVPAQNQVLIKVEASGLNFADVMARLGMYKDAPPIPCVLGYEVAGKIESTGTGIKNLYPGQRVVAFTRFGGYAEYAVADYRGVHPIPDTMDTCAATALATQYCTAWFSAEEMATLHDGDRVLISAAAGGVGTALVQMAKRRKCIVYGTCGSDEKIEYLKKLGVDFPVNYKKTDFYSEIKKLLGKQGLDVVFDSLGGRSFKKGYRLLTHGGKIVGYGAAERVHSKAFFPLLNFIWNFGFISPVFLLLQSKSVTGVNMLRISESKPGTLERCLQSVVGLAVKGELTPHVGGIFHADKISEAHNFLESRRSVGKVAVKW
jgi:NADPH2:quinone reductase